MPCCSLLVGVIKVRKGVARLHTFFSDRHSASYDLDVYYLKSYKHDLYKKKPLSCSLRGVYGFFV